MAKWVMACRLGRGGKSSVEGNGAMQEVDLVAHDALERGADVDLEMCNRVELDFAFGCAARVPQSGLRRRHGIELAEAEQHRAGNPRCAANLGGSR